MTDAIDGTKQTKLQEISAEQNENSDNVDPPSLVSSNLTTDVGDSPYIRHTIN